MSDQCHYCNHWNRLDGCLNEPCSTKESWYPQEMVRQNEELKDLLTEKDAEIAFLRAQIDADREEWREAFKAIAVQAMESAKTLE